MEDEAILDLFFAREESAIEQTRRKYGRRLLFTANNILHNGEDAEECVSDTLLKAWQSIPPVRPERFGAFLVKIARNASLGKWQANTAAKRGGGETQLLLDELEGCIPATSDPAREYEASLVTQSINTFLGGVDKTSRAAFVQRYFHSESIVEISTRFGVSESKVKSILFRLRKKLRVHLEKEGVAI